MHHLSLRALLSLVLLPFLGMAQAATVPATYQLPPAAVAEAINAVKGDPLHYAAGLPTNLDTDDGSWDEPVRGVARWRLQLESQGASSLSLRLEDLRLPQGATLRWIGNGGGGDQQGPFGPADDGMLSLPVVRDHRGLLEARMPATARAQFGLRIAEAYHGYRAFGVDAAIAKGQFGQSGSCNIDSSCSDGDAWRQQIRSVVLLSIDNSVLCTGNLVNNTAQNGRALILTANHCGIRSSNDETVIAYFNVARPCSCPQLQGRVDQNIRGATFRARDDQSDYTLFELASVPPSSFNPFYSGWDASGTAPQSGVSIHHPSGDDKKISTYTSTAVPVEDQPVADFFVDAWEVRWARGTTEQGSSGAGLWNQQRRLVGVLSGGTARCSNSGGSDYFGRLDRAWTAGLREQLAPGSSALTLDGLERGSEPPAPTCPVPGSDGGGGGALPPLLLAGLLAAALLRRRGPSADRR
ncbi:MAG TPA: trypsin-like peptidase domain-containing protein [Solimonas sp.]|nr:trypsin-like peptidase domain-containing protein [Solimonas sp.]